MNDSITREYLEQIRTTFSGINSNEANSTSGIDGMPLGMAYVSIQSWRNIYSNDVGLDRGTIFEELDLPFLGKEA